MRHYPRESKDKSNVDSKPQDNGYKRFKELLADKNRSEEVASATFEVEKTLYVHSVHELEPLREKLSPFVSWQSDQDHDSSRRGKYENISEKSSTCKESNAVSKKHKPLSDCQKLSVFNLPPLSEAATQNLENEAPKAVQLD